MTEIELTAQMYILGRVTPGNKPTFLQFEVWVRIEGTDTEVTALMTQQQLHDLKQTFLWESLKAEDLEQNPSLEDRLMDQADRDNDENKVRSH